MQVWLISHRKHRRWPLRRPDQWESTLRMQLRNWGGDAGLEGTFQKKEGAAARGLVLAGRGAATPPPPMPSLVSAPVRGVGKRAHLHGGDSCFVSGQSGLTGTWVQQLYVASQGRRCISGKIQ